MTCNRRAMMIAAVITLLGAGMTRAGTLFVTVDGAGSGGNWGDPTSLTNAVAIADPGETVLVSNGTYLVTAEMAIDKAITVRGYGARDEVIIERTGSANFRLFNLSHTDAVLSSLTVKNGTDNGIRMSLGIVTNVVVTESKGLYQASDGGGIYMTGGQVIDSLIHACGTRTSGGGGGIYMTGGEVVSCVISNNGPTPGENAVTQRGGGVRMTGGVLRRSLITGNQGKDTGGIHLQGGLVENCLVVGNNSTAVGSVGGVQQSGGRLVHTTVVDNTTILPGVSGGIRVTGGSVTNTISARNLRGSAKTDFAGNEALVSHSCAPELAVVNGNLADDPNFVDADVGDYRLDFPSMARDRGTAVTGILTDLDGNSRSVDGTGNGVAVPDMGAYEAATPTAGAFAVTITTDDPRTGFAPLGVTLEAVPFGDNTTIDWYGWDINNDGEWDLAGAGLGSVTTNLPAGQYTITLQVTNAANAMARATVTNMILAVGTDLYVSESGLHVPPFATLGNAATNVSDALNMALAGCTVHIDGGTYLVDEECSINGPITVRGMGAREDAVVAGTWDRKSWSVFRLTDEHAVLCSLTVSNGIGDQIVGGGIRLDQGTVTNVVVTHSRSRGSGASGGGVYMTGGLLIASRLVNCAVEGGTVHGGSALYMTGGEAERLTIRDNGVLPPNSNTRHGAVRMGGGTLRRSVIANNTGTMTGGIRITGSGARIENCLIVSNATTLAASVGGISMTGGQMVHSTVADNSAPVNGAAGGMEASGGSVTNAIVWGNIRGAVASDFPTGGDTYARYSLASELTPAVNGNINSDPQFETVNDVPYQLPVGSPAIDTGTNLTGIATDLAGNNRVIDGTGNSIAITDMGAYEAPEIGEGVFTANIQTLSPVSGLAPLEVILQSSFVGDNTEIAWYGWDLDGDGNFDLAGEDLGTITNNYGPGSYTVTLSATNGVGTGATVTISNLVSVLTTNLFVSTTGDTVFPYDTLQKATTNLTEALNLALEGGVVHVDAGTYFVNDPYVLDQPVTVRGLGAREDAVVAGTWDRESWSIFRLTHEDAVLCSLTVSNGIGDQTVGGAIRLDQGTVTNVVVTHSRTRGSQASGGGVYMTGGLLIASELANCAVEGGTVHGGAALYMTGGEADLLTIRDNGVLPPNSNTRHGAVRMGGGTLRRSVIANNTGTMTGGIRITGSGARIENCLIVSNVTTAAEADSVGGVSMTGGQMVNATVADNSAPATGTAGGMLATGGSVTNTIAWGNLKDGVASDFPGGDVYARYSLASELTPGAPNHNLNDDPDFEGEGDYRLQRGSIGIDAGVDQAWMETALDLQGLPRILGARVDMGCYEAQPPGGTLFILR